MTENPWLIAVINMTIVFGVLIILGILMKVIYWIDPTKKKKAQPKKAAVPAVAAALMAAIAEHKRKMEPMALPHHYF